MARRFLPLALLGVIALGGCHMPGQQNVDAVICDRANRPLDVPTSLADAGPPGMIQPSGVPQTTPTEGGESSGLQQTSNQILPIPKNLQIKDMGKRLLSFDKGYPGADV